MDGLGTGAGRALLTHYLSRSSVLHKNRYDICYEFIGTRHEQMS